ncbi:hypothetical protein A0H81_13377 [Grifola frondosa]|uniref:Uncharacterized protein n=1 Tax=Grifola frondosa TaxID=5627 RepID=A0A1C7LR87_GRIFR|nr:hypothetical protein A0H81_13377 [Grifola frondosa]
MSPKPKSKPACKCHCLNAAPHRDPLSTIHRWPPIVDYGIRFEPEGYQKSCRFPATFHNLEMNVEPCRACPTAGQTASPSTPLVDYRYTLAKLRFCI